VRLRFAVWLAEPATCEQARAWAQGLEERLGFQLFDPSLYSAAQPAYVAPPVMDGRPDPLPQRSGTLEGGAAGALQVPTRQHLRALGARAKAAARELAPLPEGEAEALPESAEVWLRALAPGAFHGPIKNATACAIGAGCEPAAVVARILEAVAVRGGPERLEKWRRELPALVDWVAARELERRARLIQQAEPHPGCEVPEVSLAEAEAHLRIAVDEWAERAAWHTAPVLPLGEDVDPPRRLVAVSVGVGKSVAAVRAVVGLLRDPSGAVRRVGFAVPTHALGGELVERFRAAGVGAMVWRGANAMDADGSPMCREPELRDAAQAAGVKLRDVCKRCPARASCAYQAQFTAQPEVWLFAHQLLFRTPPRPLASVQALVVDESFWQGAVQQAAVKLSALEADPAPLRGGDAQRLADLRAGLAERLERLAVGEKLTAEDMTETGIGSAEAERAYWALDADEAYRLEWQRKPSAADLLDGAPQTAEGLAGALKQAARFQPAIPMLWRLVGGRLAGGKLPGIVRRTAAGVQLHYRAELAEVWRKLPLLALDATADEPLVRELVGAVDVVNIRAALPRAVEVVQVVDDFMPRQSLTRREGEGGESGDTWRANRRAGLADLLELRGLRHRKAADGSGGVLGILQADPEAALRAEAGERLERAGVELAHFGAIRGRDVWRSVGCLVVVGRTLPSVSEVEQMAEVLYGVDIDPVGARWPKEAVALKPRASGAPELVETPWHPDPRVESVRQAVCDAELVQAVGRARAVRRDASQPLEVVLVGKTPVPGLVPDRLVRLADLVPTEWQMVAARHGVVPLEPAALAKAGGWASPAAAKKALQRAQGKIGTSPLDKPNFKGLSPLSELTGLPNLYRYRVPGQRGRASHALGGDDSEAARLALVQLLGAVSLWESCAAQAAQAEVLAIAAETDRPLPPAEPSEVLADVPEPSTPAAIVARRRALVAQLERHGATPLRLAARVGVSPEKLTRALERFRKRATSREAPPEARELMRRQGGLLPYVVLAELAPPAELDRALSALAREALDRRDAALRRLDVKGGGRPQAA
jgi:hypothetical protein